MFRKYELRVIMFAPTASPVVHRQRTWHIGPTTCVFTSRSFAWRETERSSSSALQVPIASTSPSIQVARARASPADLQSIHDARVILTHSPSLHNALPSPEVARG